MSEKYETGAGTTVVTDHDAKVEKKHDFSNDKVHPVGSGVGAAAGAATGAAVGTAVAGPVGTLVGAAVGAVAGGLLGHGVAEGTNPTVEDAYWRENYGNRPYANATRTYDDYQPAYRYGWESKARYGNKTWNEVEPELGNNWNDYNQGSARQTWDEAKLATKDAWHRVEDRASGDGR